LESAKSSAAIDIPKYRHWCLCACKFRTNSKFARKSAHSEFQILLYVFCKVVYNLYLSPLAGYPGPKLWAISRLPWNRANMKGRISWKIRELHDKYGPVVRIAPDELSYTTSGAWKKIYGQRNPEFVKALDGRGIAPASIGGQRSLMTEHQDRHLRLRRAIDPAFSQRAL